MNKNIVLLLFFVFYSVVTYAHGKNEIILRNGIGLGTVIAVVISWDKNKSILFAIIHGILGWLYVVYHFLTSDR